MGIFRASAQHPLPGTLDLASRVLVTNMTNEEATIALKIRFIWDKALGPKVRASLNGNKERIIEFNFSAYDMYADIAYAMALNSHIIKDSSFLSGYLRYRSQYFNFDANTDFSHLTPVAFANYFGWSLSKNTIDTDPRFRRVFSSYMEGVFLFLVAHEAAHHILGHADKPKGTNAQEQRFERQADKWALKMMGKLGSISPGAIAVLMYFGELDFPPKTSKVGVIHPDGFERAKIALDHLRINWKQHWDNVNAWFKSKGLKAQGLNGEAGIAEFELLITEALRQRAEIRSNSMYLIELAQFGNKQAQYQLATLHYTAKLGFSHDIDQSYEWHKRVTKGPHNYALLEIRQSEYSLGFYHAFNKEYIAKHGRDVDVAKRYFEKAAGKGSMRARHALNTLKEE